MIIVHSITEYRITKFTRIGVHRRESNDDEWLSLKLPFRLFDFFVSLIAAMLATPVSALGGGVGGIGSAEDAMARAEHNASN